jgi:hypothetical protein
MEKKVFFMWICDIELNIIGIYEEILTVVVHPYLYTLKLREKKEECCANRNWVKQILSLRRENELRKDQHRHETWKWRAKGIKREEERRDDVSAT